MLLTRPGHTRHDMPRYKLTVAYDGTEFHGWQKQRQGPDGPPLRTVQHVLEQAVRRLAREEVNLLGASRTDAGVHARGQVAAFTCERELPVEKVAVAVTSRLPDDLQVREARQVPLTFSPISDCTSKGYRYTVAYARGRHSPPPLFDRRYCAWTPYRLDVDRMNDAAQRLLGEHDFASFTRVNHGRDSTVRTVLDCSVNESGPLRCHIDISGTGFLYNMVRIVAGTLLEVGRGQLNPEAVPDILAARDREAAGPTMPPEGLCLMWIAYPEEAEHLDDDAP